MTKRGMISGAVPKNRRRLLLLCAGVLLLIAIACVAWWYFGHHTQKLTPHQSDVKNTIIQQEKYFQEDKNAPVKMRVLSLGNMAQSYAYIGECLKANNALREATQIATPDLKDVVNQVEKDVKGRCK